MGAVLDAENWKLAEVVVGPGEVVDHDGGYGIAPSTWIFPRHIRRGTESLLNAAAQFFSMSS